MLIHAGIEVAIRSLEDKPKPKRRKTYQPIECDVCGQLFTPTHGANKYCPECKEVIYHNNGRKLPRHYSPPVNIERYEEQTRLLNERMYKDTIIAEGYAERQRAETLKMVEPIKTTL